MLCLKAEALEQDMYPSHGSIMRTNFNSSIQRYLQKGGRHSFLSRRSSSSGDGSPSSSGMEDTNSSNGTREQEMGEKMRVYRSQLERDVLKLQKQLQDEIDLHVALVNAVDHSIAPSGSPSQLPEKAQQLLANIAVLEITVLKLEEEVVTLHFQLSQERNERRLAEYHLRHLSSATPSPISYSPTYLRDPQISPSKVSKHIGSQMADFLRLDSSAEPGYSQPMTMERTCDICSLQEITGPYWGDKHEMEMGVCAQHLDGFDKLKKNIFTNDPWHRPNQLSEEMVRCMRNIFLCLADSSNTASNLSSLEGLSSPRSPHGLLSSSSLTSFSGSSGKPSLIRSPLVELCNSCEGMAVENAFDPYKVQGKVNWTNIGRYSSAVEVSWMSVGKRQLEYAAEALKRFRLLVEELVKVNPARMNCNERLAFWINLYNALIMHIFEVSDLDKGRLGSVPDFLVERLSYTKMSGPSNQAYLAYGVPKSEIKFFSLMQKVSYTVGGHSFSAADIEFIILKTKPPAHRPQIALVLALHKFKISEEQKTYSIDNPEPLLAFALSCGMHSSPAVRIFTPDNVIEELHNSLRDYIRASVGISAKGKLLVPKLLHCYAKGIVEDSLLADWICRFLSHEQSAMVRDCTSQRKQRLLSVRSFGIVPFDSRFRYLFLLENGNSTTSVQ